MAESESNGRGGAFGAEPDAATLEVVETPETEQAIQFEEPLPQALPILPLREMVTFPDTLTPLAVGQQRSIQLVDDVLAGNRMLAMVASADPEKEEPGPEDLYKVGVAGVVARMLKVPNGTIRILVQGTQRVGIGDFVQTEPYLVARVSEMPDHLEPSQELQALTRNVQSTFSEIIEQIPYLPEELQMAVTNVDEPSTLSHLIAGALRIPFAEKQELLEEVDVAKRLRRLSEILARELEVVRLGTQIQSQVQSEIDKGQREYLLREQLKAIQTELGEGDEQQAEINELRDRIEQADLPEHARKAADRELSRLERLPPAAAEYGVIRTYLEWLVELPWSERTEDNLDIEHAREVLDEDHYDLEKVKDRILTSRRSRTASSSTWRCASSTRPPMARSSASSARRGSARPASAARSARPWAESSSASRWVECATRPRFAATGAPTSARCRARSCGRCATRNRATRCS